MTEQYMDAYRNKYREETAQVHAPLSLIEKTKAAVREEEKRLAAAVQRRESEVESAAAPGREPYAESVSAEASSMQKKRQGMPVSNLADTNRKKQRRAFSVQKWTYPLTAAAAILILASVSLTMRGFKSVNMSDTAMPAVIDEAAESGAVYENAAESADAGYMDDAMDETLEAPAAGAVETPTMEAEAEEAVTEDIMADMAEGTAAQDTDGAESAFAGQTNGSSREDAPAEEKIVDETAENSELGPADKALQKNAADAQKKEAAGEQQRGGAGQEEYTIEKVTKRPARFGGSDVKIRRYEGKSFRVLETASSGNSEGRIWEAYVETAAGEGFVISGEAKSVEDFLAAAHKKLEEVE